MPRLRSPAQGAPREEGKAIDIGEEKRTIIVEPIENPVPQKQPVEAPPVEVPDREPVPVGVPDE